MEQHDFYNAFSYNKLAKYNIVHAVKVVSTFLGKSSIFGSTSTSSTPSWGQRLEASNEVKYRIPLIGSLLFD